MWMVRRTRYNRKTQEKGRLGRHQGPEGFASKYEQTVYYDAKERKISVQYEPAVFHYERRGRGTYCRDCGSRETAKQARYTPDFGLFGVIFVETKGKFDAAARGKHEDFRKSRPDVDLRFLFASDNWVTKQHKRRYSDWCRERGIKYALGTSIPREWAEEAENLRQGGASTPPRTLHVPPVRNGANRLNRAPTVQRRKRDKVHLPGGDQE